VWQLLLTTGPHAEIGSPPGISTHPTSTARSSPKWAIPGLGIHCHPPGFNKSGIHLARATSTPLGFLWIHVQGNTKEAKNHLDSIFFLLRGLPT